MKCYWSDPDGRLREMERLDGAKGADQVDQPLRPPAKKPDPLEKAKRRPGVRFVEGLAAE
jgi:hypothetical protein